MSLREINLRRIGSRHGLYFYVDVESQTVVFHNNAEAGSRQATDEEVCLWKNLCPEDPENLPATQAEVIRSLTNRTGPFTVNPVDFMQIWGLLEYIPEEDPDKVQEGLYGRLNGQDIYVSRGIPLGTYYQGPRLPKLHTGSDAKWQGPIESENWEFWELDPQPFIL